MPDRKRTADELFAEDASKVHLSADDLFAAEGEPGAPGHNQYAVSSSNENPRRDVPVTPMGTWGDAAKSWADKAALGAGPQIAGAMGAVANALTDPLNISAKDIDAYRDVRNQTARQLSASENTMAGGAVTPLAMMSTPIPVKSLGPGASLGARAWQGAKVGGVTSALQSLATDPQDLITTDAGPWTRALVRALARGTVGAGGGAAASVALGSVDRGARSLAETQALRAAGLRGGIKNSLQKDLGISGMDEARQLGRKFLDEDLIPPIGSSEAVAERAQRLENEAGNAIGSTMHSADVATMYTPPNAGGTVAGRPSNVAPRPGFDYDAMGNASGDVLKQASAPADILSGQKARGLADAFKAQEKRTPGSFVGANQAKSDAWKSASFADDAPMAAQLYRKAVGAARDDIERQVADALGPDAAASLRDANQRYGVAADALKLANNASTRDLAKKGLGMPEILAITTSAGSGAGNLAGHPVAGGLGGLGLALGAKAFDKYGHSSTSRFADWLARRAAESSGGVVGGSAANSLVDAALRNQPATMSEDDSLSKWLRYLEGE